MSKDQLENFAELADIVGQLILKEQISESLIFALIRLHPNKEQLSNEIRRIAEEALSNVVEYPNAEELQGVLAIKLNAALEACGQSPGSSPDPRLRG